MSASRKGPARSNSRRRPFTSPSPAPISRPSPQSFGTGHAVAQRAQRIDRLGFHKTLKLRFSEGRIRGFLRLGAPADRFPAHAGIQSEANFRAPAFAGEPKTEA